MSYGLVTRPVGAFGQPDPWKTKLVGDYQIEVIDPELAANVLALAQYMPVSFPKVVEVRGYNFDQIRRQPIDQATKDAVADGTAKPLPLSKSFLGWIRSRQDEGKAIIGAPDHDAWWATDDLVAAAAVTAGAPDRNVVFFEPLGGWKKPLSKEAKLYLAIGAGVAGVGLVGGLIYYARKRKGR